MLGVGFSLAVVAGFFAAMASVFSKLAFEDAGTTLKHFTCPFLAENLCTNVVLFLRVTCFLLLLLSNALMWTLFVKALQGCQTTVEAAVTNSGSNFICTALFGIFLFGESVSLMWWFGASLVVMGLMVMQYGAEEEHEFGASNKKIT